MSAQVTVQPSGRRFTVEPDETVLSAAIRQGVGLPYGCRDGACGSCQCRLVLGEVSHAPHLPSALSAEVRKRGLILTCCAQACGDITLASDRVTDIASHPVRKLIARVTAMERKSPDVMLLSLVAAGTEPWPYHAGQYLDVLLRDGSRRSYSMANAPLSASNAAPSWELHIRHLPGGQFTDHVFAHMKVKDVLRCEGPYGAFFLREPDDMPLVFLASGTGFAPIKALIEQLEAMQSRQAVTVYWGGRRKADLYLHDWMQRKAADMPNLRYVPVLSDPAPADAWTGRTGYVHLAVFDDFEDLSGHQVYACGAPIVVESARSAYVERLRLPAGQFHADAFTSLADRSPVAPLATGGD